MIDPLDLSRALIRCPSVTPEDAGAIAVLEKALGDLGFACQRLPFAETGTADVENLYARIGSGGPNFCFAGHTDVVPIGDRQDWQVDPFGAAMKDGKLFGRGSADMKCAIACFAAATSRFIAARGEDFGGSISLLITGDEEGPAINGTVKMLSWMAEQGETMDVCVVGEPTSGEAFGDTIKIGRRGSLNGHLTVFGEQGHVAYPQLADNPMPGLLALLSAISENQLDDGTDHFQASNLEITAMDTANQATNVIPAKVDARFNIRFNDIHTGATLEQKMRDLCDAVAGPANIRYGLDLSVSGEAFLTPPGALSDILQNAVQEVTGLTPELSTTGGTSDARFIKDYCPVAELGLKNATAHKVDEHVEIGHIKALADIYTHTLNAYFKS
ncbi:MAG TPA: succinyl-diaminopimelate desuccinylase [Rhodospirillales bacterium]|nr:succinyl-diaminopimelate desuccinylase [Rhodospirillales bacterium]